MVVGFELGRANRVNRVVDCQRMQVINRLEGLKFVNGGIVKRDPAKARATLIQLDLFVDRDFPDSLTLVVIVCGDDANAGLAGRCRPRWTAGRESPRSSHAWTFE